MQVLQKPDPDKVACYIPIFHTLHGFFRVYLPAEVFPCSKSIFITFEVCSRFAGPAGQVTDSVHIKAATCEVSSTGSQWTQDGQLEDRLDS